MKKKIIFVLLVNWLFALFFLNQVQAAFSFQIDQVMPDTIYSKNDEVVVNLSIKDLPSESYFRVAFQKSDGGNYFGYMKNDLGDWVKVNENDCKKFYHVVDKNVNSLQIFLKIGEDSNVESGIYNVKSHRYTASCSSFTAATASAQINFIFPTLIPTQTPPLIQSPTSIAINPTLTPEPTLISYNNIYLSEVMVYPPSGVNEWMEIFNDNNFPVSLIDWYIDDGENAGSSPKKFFLEVPAKSYGVIDLSTSMFNNSGDSVRLLDFNKQQKDSFEYLNARQGKTYGRASFENDDFCLQEPSKGLANNNCLNPTATPTAKPTLSTNLSLTPPPKISFTSSQKIATNGKQPSNKINLLKKITEQNRQKIALVNQKAFQEEILGASTQNKKTNKPLINSLTFLSFSYSLLTISSIFFKIKKYYEKNS